MKKWPEESDDDATIAYVYMGFECMSANPRGASEEQLGAVGTLAESERARAEDQLSEITCEEARIAAAWETGPEVRLSVGQVGGTRIDRING